MLAVIKTGGKQYIVSPKKKIKIEKLDIEEGKEIIFEDVLLVNDGEKTIVGKPLIEGATVVGEVLKQDRHKKLLYLNLNLKKDTK
jgi:large subunit ribosomal protein L21